MIRSCISASEIRHLPPALVRLALHCHEVSKDTKQLCMAVVVAVAATATTMQSCVCLVVEEFFPTCSDFVIIVMAAAVVVDCVGGGGGSGGYKLTARWFEWRRQS